VRQRGRRTDLIVLAPESGAISVRTEAMRKRRDRLRFSPALLEFCPREISEPDR
jgi:hypothetical protein